MTEADGLIVVTGDASARVERAARWLSERGDAHVTIIGASVEAASTLARRAILHVQAGASFGWSRTTLDLLADALARTELARRGLTFASPLAVESVCAAVVYRLRDKLGRFAPIADRPGFPRALARTITELRLFGSPKLACPDLTLLVGGFERALADANLVDRAGVLAIATDAANAGGIAPFGHCLLLDVAVVTLAEQSFVAALTKQARSVLATVPSGDARTLRALGLAMPQATLDHAAVSMPHGTSALTRLKSGLFGEGPLAVHPRGDDVVVLSAPGEHREATEIARHILREAKNGTTFENMAVLLRSLEYRDHLAETLARANIPTFFEGGEHARDPGGRALLALLACAAEGLSARRFAEYLALGELPHAPFELPSTDATDAAEPTDVTERGKTLDEQDARETARPTPRRWEKLLADAAVIRGKERWTHRLDALHGELTQDVAAYEAKGEADLGANVARDLEALEHLQRFARPILEALDALPVTRADATWGDWLAGLSTLATCAVRAPEQVLSVLAELGPMAEVGPVDVAEVRFNLERRLAQGRRRPAGSRRGRVYIAQIDDARGMTFDVVFVPGLAEKMFPRKVALDPLLLDDARRALGADLPTNVDRTEAERLLLMLAVGAAKERVVFSYPRLDMDQGRPRTPSFYGLEILRVADGEVRGFEHLAEVAATTAEARLGWPAPARAEDAIDEAEHDLALLDSILKKSEADAVGEAHYLLNANEHLARALRFRGRRWLKGWRASDGLVDPPPEALAALAPHALDKRSFSPTALQNYATCPYRFFLSAIHKLAPREEPEEIEDLDPLTRGSLVHEVQFALLTRLRDMGLLPVTKPRLEAAFGVLDEVLGVAARDAHARLMPAIERVFADTIVAIAADMREWLRRATLEPSWTPAFFELSFGLKDRRDQDDKSDDRPVDLDCGIRLRGSIDLIERDDGGGLRATDYKTGKVRATQGTTVIGGGETLQPVLYALTVEKLFPGVEIRGGRLYYCTTAGEFQTVDIPLTREAREAAKLVATTIGGALSEGFLPAAPAKDACKYCDFRPVCGPYEETRVRRKQPLRLKPLADLRRHK